MNGPSLPSMPIPARVLELQARFGVSNTRLGHDADAFLFSESLDAAAADIGGTTALSSSTTPGGVTPTFVGTVIDADGTIADNVPYADMFKAAGARHGISPSILAAVAKTESAFDPTAVSPAGAQGLMQFMPATAAEMGVDPLDPASAIDGAARYLAQNLRQFGSIDLALAAYNAGPGAVRTHGGIPPFAETQAYVPKVLSAAGLTPSGASL